MTPQELLKEIEQNYEEINGKEWLHSSTDETFSIKTTQGIIYFKKKSPKKQLPIILENEGYKFTINENSILINNKMFHNELDNASLPFDISESLPLLKQAIKEHDNLVDEK